MNYFFAVRPKREREYQQLVERENNDRKDSNYYIADIEYTETDSRFDMIAVHRKDRSDYTKIKLAIIEMKYGEKAISFDKDIISLADFLELTEFRKKMSKMS